MQKTILWFILSLASHLSPSQSVVVLKDIQLAGNKKTKSFVILNELPVTVGDTIEINRIPSLKKEIAHNVFNTGLFNYVTVKDSLQANNLYLTIQVAERWYIWPYPILEQADINFSSFLYYQNWSRINYGIMTMWYNFRGRRDFLKFKIRKGYKQQYGITYYNPYLNKGNRLAYSLEANRNIRHEYPITVRDMKFAYYRNDTINVYDNLFSKATLYYRWNLYTSLAVSLSYNRTKYAIPENTELYNFPFLPNRPYTYWKPAISLTWDKRDIHYYPLSGFYLSLQTAYSQYTEGTQEHFLSIATDIRRYVAINQKIFLSARLYFYPLVCNFVYDYPAFVSKHIRASDFLIYPTRALLQTSFRYNILPQRSFDLRFIPWSKINKPFLAVYTGFFADAAIIPEQYLQDKRLMSAGAFIDFVTYYDKVLRIEAGINSLNQIGIYLNFGSAF